MSARRTAPKRVIRQWRMLWPITEMRTPLDQLFAAATHDLLATLRDMQARPASPPTWGFARPGGTRLHLECRVDIEMPDRLPKGVLA